MGVAERRAREREARRESILDAAVAVFEQRGFDGATVEAIAAAAEINIATLYYYFPSKDLLYLAVLRRAIDVVLPRLEAAAAAGRTPAEKLRNLAGTYYRFFREHPEAQSVLRCLQSKALPTEDPATRETVTSVYLGTRHAIGVVTRVIAAAVESGAFRELDPRETAVLFWAGLNGIFQMAENKGVFREDPEGPLLDRYVDLFVRGMEAGRASPPARPALRNARES